MRRHAILKCLYDELKKERKSSSPEQMVSRVRLQRTDSGTRAIAGVRTAPPSRTANRTALLSAEGRRGVQPSRSWIHSAATERLSAICRVTIRMDIGPICCECIRDSAIFLSIPITGCIHRDLRRIKRPCWLEQGFFISRRSWLTDTSFKMFQSTSALRRETVSVGCLFGGESLLTRGTYHRYSGSYAPPILNNAKFQIRSTERTGPRKRTR
jgi:hypothetical protein